jgi:hypothetical protein
MPFRTCGVDFRFYFSLGERGEWQGSQLISCCEQMCHSAALYLRPQQGF